MKDKAYNYVYEITYSDGRKYIGLRSCDCPIEDDTYLGSGFHIPEELVGTEVKSVLSTHNTREEAGLEEIRLHALYDVRNNDKYLNQCNATSTKFYCSEEAHKRGAETRRGRTKETHEYIAKQVESRAQYKGKGLTTAQRDQWLPEKMPKRMQKYKATLAETMKDPEKAAAIHDAKVRGGKSCAGIPNPKKGHTGSKHPRQFDWWYIAPGQDKVIVKDSVRNYCNNNDIFPKSSATIMRFLREEHVPSKLRAQGWDFGKVDSEE